MTIYFVGPGGSNANNGTTWALRKLTLTGAEALALVGDDVVRVGPGTYRETLTTSHNGSSGHPITYIADEGGTLTDGIGGEVRITGSDNDQIATRSNCIAVASTFRTFIGLHCDAPTGNCVDITNSDAVLDKCVFQGGVRGVVGTGANAINTTVQHCLFFGQIGGAIQFTHTVNVANCNVQIINCLICNQQSGADDINWIKFSNWTVQNCTILGGGRGVRQQTVGSGGGTVVGCILGWNATAFQATATSDFTEDYNDIYGASTPRTNVTAGAHSVGYPPLFVTPLLTLGLHIPITGYLASYSQLGALALVGGASDDHYSVTRPATPSWGAVQYESGRRPSDAGYSAARRMGGK